MKFKTVFNLILIFSLLVFASCEQRFNGKTESEWQEYANESGLPVQLPGKTIYPENHHNKKLEYSDENIEHKTNTTDESYNNSSEEESVEEELTEDFVDAVFSYKRTCKCCGNKFSPKTNISEFDDCSESATIASYEFCSGKCCRNYNNGYCE